MKYSYFNYKYLKSILRSLQLNFNGHIIQENIIVFESDDWGAIRTPSRNALHEFEKFGLSIQNSVYKNDSLESGEDLEALFQVLVKHKDAFGNHPSFTANMVVANPDFSRIKNSGFLDYQYEPVTTTLKKYPAHGNNIQLYHQGIQCGLFRPQFHGREHLNINRWMKRLQSGDQPARFCFDFESTWSGKDDYSFMEAFDWDHPTEIAGHISVIEDGLNLFRELFGYSAKTFIAPCYNWDSAVEPLLFESGIRWIQGVRNQLAPTGSFNSYRKIPHKFGDRNEWGLRYNIRNCFLEPAMNPKRDWISTVMAQIEAAFLCKKPAVICSHRINYIGFIDEDNRTRGLKILDELLSKIIRRWPDVRFVTTDQLDQFLS